MSDIIRQFQLATIQERFWIDDFKQGQEDAINHILDGSDTLIKMPTWWGKSLCYQWPAAITRNKVMIVTSPLISLMGDQLQSLSHHGVSATTINWNTSDSDRMDKMRRMREWEYRMLYVAPETLVKKRFLSEAWRVDFDRIVSDEAQCISKWWNWFRPDYLAIWQAARRLCIEQKIACSATIDWEVEEDIIRLDGREIWASIAYCRTVPETEELYHYLIRHWVQNVFKYHGQMSPIERQNSFNNFKQLDSPIVVWTSACWMWIDRADVRLVIQYGEPYSLFDFIQAGGRAWRDGLPARIISMYRQWRFAGEKEFQNRATLPSMQYVEKIYFQIKKLQDTKRLSDIAVFRRAKIRQIEWNEELSSWQREVYIQMVLDAILILRRSGLIIDYPSWGFNLTELKIWGDKHKKIIEHTEAIAETEARNTKQMFEYFNSEVPDQKRLLQIAGIE